jgi:hypothetical protein
MLIKARFFGFLLAVALFAVGMTFQSSHQPRSTEQSHAAQHQTENKGGADSREAQSLWVPIDSVGLYTLVLSVFTGVLAIVSIFQGVMLLRSDKTARIAAIAADLSAKAAVAVDLPVLIPSKIALYREPGVTGLVQGYPGSVSTFRINFKNLGRTAAELVTQCIEWKVVSQLPEIPAYKTSFPFVPGTFVEYGNELPAVIQNFVITLQPDEVEAISKEAKFLWVYGYVSFKDFLGNGHEQRWCTKWQAFALRPDGARGPLGFVYDSITPPEYTKRT